IRPLDRIAVHIERDFIALRSVGALHFQITNTTRRSEALASLVDKDRSVGFEPGARIQENLLR
ncbi:MAG: hypothetical protein M3410_15865, partial [Acidobacteriota bacterium]|nr:hypothetical protein [Acidobacteriota bacterium]